MLKRSLYLSRLSPIIMAAFYAYHNIMADEYAKDWRNKTRKCTRRSFTTTITIYTNLTTIDRDKIRDSRWFLVEKEETTMATISKERRKIFFLEGNEER